MDRDRLAQALLATFLDELEGHVAALNRELLALERDTEPSGRAARLAAMNRTVHTVKGSARAANVELIETACHRMEEVLTLLSPEHPPDPPRVELLFSAADALDDAGRRLRKREDLKDSPLAALLSTLANATQGQGASSAKLPSEHTAAGHDESLPIKVSAQKLDALLAQSGEIRVATLRLEHHVAALDSMAEMVLRLERGGADTGAGRDAVARSFATLRDSLGVLYRELAADQRRLSAASVELEEEVRRARTVSFGTACAGMERTVRDLCRSEGKQAQLVIEGEALEVDRGLISSLRDALLHLVRNAVSHGLEPTVVRARGGKPQTATLRVAAKLSGGRIEFSIEDDGAGIDLDALRERARARQLEVPEDDEEAKRLVFVPGLSTAQFVTSTAGRGIGMDAVRAQVERLGGSVGISTRKGKGTRITLLVPLTLSTVKVVLMEAGGQRFAIPSDGIEQLLRLRAEELQTLEGGKQVLRRANASFPVARLAWLLGLPPSEAGTVAPALLLKTPEFGSAVVVVDSILGEQEVLVRPGGARLTFVRHGAGFASLADGALVVLLQPASLVRGTHAQQGAQAFKPPAAAKVSRRILLVDDAPTTRALEQSILESAGYEVMACADGQQGWDRLQQEGADAVVADVEMPAMDGFALTQAIRASPRFGRLPVVLVTARERDEDKRRGLESGANAYLVKSSFDQTKLLEALERLL